MTEREYLISIDAMTRRVAELEQMRDHLQAANTRYLQRARDAEERLAARVMHAKSVRDVLKPFAKIAQQMTHVRDPKTPVSVTIPFEDFVAARDFLVEAE